MADHKEAGHAHVHGGITMGHGDDAAHSHPGWKFYVMIGVVLCIITGVEVAIVYIPQLASIMIPILLTLSAAKFIIVVLFYMHLKSDSVVFSRVFFAPMALATLVIIGMIILFKVIPHGVAG